jgi:uncharacterized membrane protein
VLRFNELQAKFGGRGLRVIGANSTDTDQDIADFVTTFGVTYAVARVADTTGYTVPSFSTVYAINRDGTILFTGPSSQVTDAMVEQWLGKPDDSDDEDESCSTGHTRGTGGAAVVLAALLALGWRATRRSACPESPGRTR